LPVPVAVDNLVLRAVEDPQAKSLAVSRRTLPPNLPEAHSRLEKLLPQLQLPCSHVAKAKSLSATW